MTKKMLAAGYDFGGSSAKLAADLSPTNSTVTLADITGLGLAIGIGQYDFDFLIPYQSAATTAGLTLSLSGPTVSFVSYTVQVQTQTTTNRSDFRAALATSASGGNVSTANTTWSGRITGRVITTAAGTLQPQYATTTATVAITIKAGAYGSVTPRL